MTTSAFAARIPIRAALRFPADQHTGRHKTLHAGEYTAKWEGSGTTVR